ncbi:hypothetical protein BMS3Abin05_00046 [bacterium BMS3Abin05]|nr:hypothetical protein BMS3Abin05_00046 [bacterium BMS3Abin05]
MQWFNSNILALIPLILVFGLALSGTGKIVAYSANPIFSFSQMAHGVGRIIQAREGKIHDVVLFGNIADSVALEIGVRSVNTVLGIRSLNLKLKEYRPKYLLLHTDYKKVVEAVRSEGGHVTRLASWDVYGNYYGNGQKVQILSVRWN